MLVKSFLFYLFPSFTIRILQILVLITSDKQYYPAQLPRTAAVLSIALGTDK